MNIPKRLQEQGCLFGNIFTPILFHEGMNMALHFPDRISFRQQDKTKATSGNGIIAIHPSQKRFDGRQRNHKRKRQAGVLRQVPDDPCHFAIKLVIQHDDLTHGILCAKVFAGNAFGQYDRIGRRQCCPGIAGQPLIIEYLRYVFVGKGKVLLVVAVISYFNYTVVIKELRYFQFREIVSQRGRDDRRNPGIIVDGMMVDPVDPIRLRIIGIIPQFETDHQKNDETGGNAQCKSPDIDQGVTEAAANIPQAGKEVFHQHEVPGTKNNTIFIQYSLSTN